MNRERDVEGVSGHGSGLASRRSRDPLQGPATDPSFSIWLPGHPARLPGLDGIRGLACLAVMLYHFGGMIDPTRLGTPLLWKLTSMCWCGGSVFAVLSGFLITGILFNTRSSPHYFRSFFGRRAVRIFPLHYGLLLVVFGIMAVFPERSASTEWLFRHQQWLWLYNTNSLIALTGQRLRTEWCNFGHFWSLSLEEHFYLVWPFLVAACSPKRLKWISVLLLALSLACRIALYPRIGETGVRVLTLCRMDALVVGSLLYQLLRGAPPSPRLLRNSRWLLGLVSFALAALYVIRGTLHPRDHLVQIVGYPLVALAAAGVLMEILCMRAKAGRIARWCAALDLAIPL